MMKKALLLAVLLLVTGCISVAPKMTKLADVEAKLTAQIGAQGNSVDAKLALIETKIETTINQRIGKITGGQVNTGMFAGGAFYVLVLSVLTAVLFSFIIIFLLRRGNNWKAAYRTSRELLTTKPDLAAGLADKLHTRGLHDIADKS